MSDRQASSVRDAIALLPSGRSRRYSAALKARVLDVVRARREQDASWEQLSEELGVSLETLRRWYVVQPPRAARRLRRVHVVAERERAGAVSVVSASGHRVEGLTLDQTIALLRALG
jgi:transposase-like protein